MEKIPSCKKCGSEYTYEVEGLYICPECAYEWPKNAEIKEEESPGVLVVKDAFGTILHDGDSVTIIKDIKVKGSSSVIKIGTKVTDIRLVDAVNGHNIDAKVKGFGSMMLKSEIVKKSQ
jgi:protein PhnA